MATRRISQKVTGTALVPANQAITSEEDASLRKLSQVPMKLSISEDPEDIRWWWTFSTEFKTKIGVFHIAFNRVPEKNGGATMFLGWFPTPQDKTGKALHYQQDLGKGSLMIAVEERKRYDGGMSTGYEWYNPQKYPAEAAKYSDAMRLVLPRIVYGGIDPQLEKQQTLKKRDPYEFICEKLKAEGLPGTPEALFEELRQLALSTIDPSRTSPEVPRLMPPVRRIGKEPKGDR